MHSMVAQCNSDATKLPPILSTLCSSRIILHDQVCNQRSRFYASRNNQPFYLSRISALEPFVFLQQTCLCIIKYYTETAAQQGYHKLWFSVQKPPLAGLTVISAFKQTIVWSKVHKRTTMLFEEQRSAAIFTQQNGKRSPQAMTLCDTMFEKKKKKTCFINRNFKHDIPPRMSRHLPHPNEVKS